MATSKLLQSLDATFSDGTDRGITPSSRTQIETFIASGTIVAGDLVSLDIENSDIGKRALNIVQSDDGDPNRVVVGFALHGGSAGDPIRVTISGYHKDANVTTGLNRSAPVQVGSVPGRADVHTTTKADIVIAFLATPESGNKADVIVLKQF